MSELLRSCVFCGSNEKLTADHVPPQNVFPKPRPSDLITVPACLRCNSSASNDDEYFRLKLCMSEQVGNDPDARENRETIFRSLDKPEAPGLKRAFASDIRKVWIPAPAGLYLRALAFDVDLQRIFRTIEKTVKGLFFHEMGYRLRSDYEVAVQSNDTLKDKDFLEELQQTILIPLSQKSPKVIGNGTFSYRFHSTEEDPFVSVWALTFYREVPFLCLTGPTVATADLFSS